MATGDNNNQNLFGTNYNQEEEKRKKAELAAQNARMGSGEAQAPLNLLDVASRQNTPGVLPMSDESNNPTSKEEVDAMVGSFMDRFGQRPGFFNQFEIDPELNRIYEDIDAKIPKIPSRIEEIMRAVENPQENAALLAGLNPDQIFDDPESQERQARIAQSKEETDQIIRENVTVTPEQRAVKNFMDERAALTGETPTDVITPFFPTAVPGSAQANFIKRMATGEPLSPEEIKAGEAFVQGTQYAFDPVIGYSDTGVKDDQQAQGQETVAPIPPMGQDATRARLGGRTLNEYLSAPSGTEGVSGLRTDPQGRMIPAGFETRAEAFPSYEDEADKRTARLDARPDFNEAISDRDRRAARGDGISMADQTAMAKANARGATPTEVARGNQVASELNLDLRTGQPLQATGALTFDQQLAQNKFEFDVNKFNFEQAKEASDEATANAQSATVAKFAVRDQMRQAANVMDKAQRAGKNIGFFTTGLAGGTLGLVAGTEAYDQKATIETLEADAAFSALQRMRDASKTGGALGNVSERELDLLKATAGSLRVGQSEEQFRENLGQYVQRYNQAMLNIYDAFVADYGEKDANEAFQVNGRQDLTSSQGQAPANDQNYASAADALLSKY
jgi:hypothetical protein